MSDRRTRPQRALISVSDKTGLVAFATKLAAHDIALISTGGSAKALRDAGLTVAEVADVTRFPEMLDGRVKTLHPAIHGGILAKRDEPAHLEAIAAQAIAPIDLVVVNLYPFEATVDAGAGFETCVENIDIGGPSLIRAAAKNHPDVTVLVDPADYDLALREIDEGGTTLETRRHLAAKAFARCGAYDAAIAGWFNREIGIERPKYLALGGTLQHDLRYGENPHQQGGFYVGSARRPGVGTATQLQGKELSYNNLNDTDAAFELVAEFPDPAVAIIKHANPCGVATARALDLAYRRALACDPVSAFGGIIALNRSIDAATARLVAELFAEVVIAPEITEEARAILAEKKALRVLVTGALPDPQAPGLLVRSLAGGLLVQGRDTGRVDADALKLVTKRAPTPEEMRDMLIAASVVKHVKSNAIVLVKDAATVGIGGGQTSRVDAARQAVEKAQAMALEAGETMSRASGAVLASDAFFPFADGLEICLEAGVTAVLQPGGSKRDQEVIEAAEKHGAAMVFSGLRAFRH